MRREDFAALKIDASVELIVSGVVTRVRGVDYDDDTIMDETGAWHSFADAEVVQ